MFSKLDIQPIIIRRLIIAFTTGMEKAPDGDIKMEIRILQGISELNAHSICRWSNLKGKDFQEQWMGQQVDYPLSYDKLRNLENLFSIFCDSEFIGVIQKVKIDTSNIHIGRFILNPEKAGLGLGKRALQEFERIIFSDISIKSISLTVFDFNKSAKYLYEKLGFTIDEVIESPKTKYKMKKYRENITSTPS